MLITCHQCSKAISTHATACPHCDQPLPTKAYPLYPATGTPLPRNLRMRRTQWAFIYLMLIGLFVGFVIPSDSDAALVFGLMASLLGFCGAVATRVAIWWDS